MSNIRGGTKIIIPVEIVTKSSIHVRCVHWRNSPFMELFGKAGTNFVSEYSKLLHNYGIASAMKCIALKAAMVMPAAS